MMKFEIEACLMIKYVYRKVITANTVFTEFSECETTDWVRSSLLWQCSYPEEAASIGPGVPGPDSVHSTSWWLDASRWTQRIRFSIQQALSFTFLLLPGTE